MKPVIDRRTLLGGTTAATAASKYLIMPAFAQGGEEILFMKAAIAQINAENEKRRQDPHRPNYG